MYVATTNNKIQAKLSNKGTVCVFVGYSVSYANDVYRSSNPKKCNIKSRDVVWLKKGYGLCIKSKNENDTSVNDDSDSAVDNFKNKLELKSFLYYKGLKLQI
jgi:hypothetical protein